MDRPRSANQWHKVQLDTNHQRCTPGVNPGASQLQGRSAKKDLEILVGQKLTISQQCTVMVKECQQHPGLH